MTPPDEHTRSILQTSSHQGDQTDRHGPPRVLVPCDNRTLNGHPYHVLGQKYTDAIRQVACCLPIMLPTDDPAELSHYLAMCDGILLTGSPANVHPRHFGQEVADPSLPLDTGRDAVTLPLIRWAVAHGVPVLAICRGLQEINVALGGSLLQAVHAVPGRMDHRVRIDLPPFEQYEPVHAVDIVAESHLARIAGSTRAMVNSAHGQAIDRLAEGLSVEATAEDGTIEAVRVTAHPGFALALQWHPEWRAARNPLSTRIFSAFGAACRDAQQARAAQVAHPNHPNDFPS